MNNESKYKLVLNSLATELEFAMVNEECLYKLNETDFNRVIDNIKKLTTTQVLVYSSRYEDYGVVYISYCYDSKMLIFDLGAKEPFMRLFGESKYYKLLEERLNCINYDCTIDLNYAVNMVELKESLYYYINNIKLLADGNLFVPVPKILENNNDCYTFELYNFSQEFLTKSQALELYLYTLEKLESLYEMERNKLRSLEIMSSFINIKEYLFDEDSAEILDLVYKQCYKYNGVK